MSSSERPSRLVFVTEPVSFIHSPNYSVKLQSLDFKLCEDMPCPYSAHQCVSSGQQDASSYLIRTQ